MHYYQTYHEVKLARIPYIGIQPSNVWLIVYIQNSELKTRTMEIVYHSINKYYEEIKTPFPGIKTYLQKAWNGKLDVCETYSTQL